MKKLLLGLAAAVGAWKAAQWMNSWGASDAELQGRFAGEDILTGPARLTTMAVTIKGQPDQLWAELMRLGIDQAQVSPVDGVRGRIAVESRTIEVGDSISVAPGGLGLLSESYTLEVVRLYKPRALVMRQGSPLLPWESLWILSIQEVGPGICRLVCRTRTRRNFSLVAITWQVVAGLRTPLTWMVIRRLLLEIRERVEEQVPAPFPMVD